MALSINDYKTAIRQVVGASTASPAQKLETQRAAESLVDSAFSSGRLEGLDAQLGVLRSGLARTSAKEAIAATRTELVNAAAGVPVPANVIAAAEAQLKVLDDAANALVFDEGSANNVALMAHALTRKAQTYSSTIQQYFAGIDGTLNGPSVSGASVGDKARLGATAKDLVVQAAAFDFGAKTNGIQSGDLPQQLGTLGAELQRLSDSRLQLASARATIAGLANRPGVHFETIRAASSRLDSLEAAVEMVPFTADAARQVSAEVSSVIDGLERVKAPPTLTVRPGEDLKGVIESATPGTTVRLEAGRFTLHGTVDVPEGVTIQGAGPGTVVVNDAQFDARLGYVPTSFNVINKHGCTIKDLTIDGTKSRGGTGIDLEGGGGHTIQGVTMRNVGGFGVQMGRTTNNQILNNDISDSANTGISMWQCDDNLISGNVSNRNGSEGVTVDHGSSRNRVLNNTLLENCQRGGVGAIGIDGGRETNPNEAAADNLIDGNFIRGTLHAYAGITCQNNEGPTLRNRITNNTIEHVGGPGVWLKNKVGSGGDEWNGTNNTAQTPTLDSAVENNRIRVTGWGAFSNALVVDGGATEALEQGKPLDAQLELANGQSRVVGAGSANSGNVVRGNVPF